MNIENNSSGNARRLKKGNPVDPLIGLAIQLSHALPAPKDKDTKHGFLSPELEQACDRRLAEIYPGLDIVRRLSVQ